MIQVKHTGVPGETLAGGEVGDLWKVSTPETKYNIVETLTNRGVPSGSPTLMTVHSCLESEEPTKTSQ
jgi:hypothetical protein